MTRVGKMNNFHGSDTNASLSRRALVSAALRRPAIAALRLDDPREPAIQGPAAHFTVNNQSLRNQNVQKSPSPSTFSGISLQCAFPLLPNTSLPPALFLTVFRSASTVPLVRLPAR